MKEILILIYQLHGDQLEVFSKKLVIIVAVLI